jgi:4-carboxymuconolactone decarboxylase
MEDLTQTLGVALFYTSPMNLRFITSFLLLSVSALAQDRMPPIPAEKLTSAQKKVLEVVTGPPRGAAGAGGPFVPLLRSPELMNHLQAVGGYLRFNNSLPKKLVELAALMTARHFTQQYEWDGNYSLALGAGLSSDTINAIAAGRRPDKLAVDEEVVYNFIAELLQYLSVSDATYERLLSKFGEQGVVDTVGLVGYYSTLAMILNVARSPGQPDSSAPKLAPFPH